jgi:hypothetical protein
VDENEDDACTENDLVFVAWEANAKTVWLLRGPAALTRELHVGSNSWGSYKSCKCGDIAYSVISIGQFIGVEFIENPR